MTQESRQRKCTENSQEMYYSIPEQHRQMLRISEIRAACKDHILWLDDLPPHPEPDTYCSLKRNEAQRTENMSTDNEKLRSVKLWSLSPLVGGFSTAISLPTDPGTGVRVLYVSAVRAQNAGSKQNVLAVGPQGPCQ